MSQIKITLILDIPDDARVSTPDVDYQEPPGLMEMAGRVFAEEVKYDADELVRPAAQGVPGCPQHGAMTRWPAGVSKKPGGKPYSASWRCPVKDCATKPLWDAA